MHHKLITKALQKTALDRFKDGDHWPALASLSSDVLSDAHKQDVDLLQSWAITLNKIFGRLFR